MNNKPLDSYLARPESVYRWEKRGERRVGDVTIHDLWLVSQTWQGIVWQHRLQLFVPDTLRYPDFATLYNTGGGGSGGNDAIGIDIARNTGAAAVNLLHIPNQPLYGGLTEDDLVVYTWKKFLETGEPSWPLHFPMAKAVLKAMDALQSYRPQLKRFLVWGGSKRGWTSWLVGASQDKRVVAIAPMVIDVLNVPKQFAHQREVYKGGYSEQIAEYIDAGIDKLVDTPRGRELLALEDPYSYLDRLTLPKLLVLGTNDRFWSQDALNIYWDELKGPKWVLYTPNSGHGLDDRTRVFATLNAFARKTAAGQKWPQWRWTYTPEGKGARLTVTSDTPILAAHLFGCTAPTQDFRDSRWSARSIVPDGKGFTVFCPPPRSGYAAVYGEATFELEPGQAFRLATQMRILTA